MMRIMARRTHAENAQQKIIGCTQRGFAFRRSEMQWNMDMRFDASRGIVYGTASTLLLMLLVTWAAAQNSDITNVDLCNGRGRSSPESQIAGCTALIKEGADNSKLLTNAYNNRGNAHAGNGQFEQAIEDYDEAIKLDPNYTKALNNRGVVYEKTGDYDRAIKDFDAAINIDPNYSVALANRAETFQKRGDYPSALKDFDQAIQLQPTLRALWNERCWTHAIVGELQAALADCNEAIRLEPNVAATFDSRGFTYLKLGQWDLAIADYNSALQIEPKLPSALYGRGFAKLKKADRTGGNADIAAAEVVQRNIAAEFARYGLH